MVGCLIVVRNSKKGAAAAALALLLAACGGGQSKRAEWDHAEDIEIPWSSDKAPATQGATPSGAQAAVVDAPAGALQNTKGALIDFDVKDTDLHDALRLLAESADINIVVADTVSGRITLRVLQASWKEILQTIANMKHLTLRQEDNIYYVR